MRLAEIVTATGVVVAEWSGSDNQAEWPTAPPGRSFIPVPSGSAIGKRWNGSAFEPYTPAASRILSPLDFARLFTQAEDDAIEASADATVKFLRRRLQLAQAVNLDHADVVNGTSVLVSKGLLTAARRTAILAGTPPS